MKKRELAIFAVVGISAISAVWYWSGGGDGKSASAIANSSGNGGTLSTSSTRTSATTHYSRRVPLNAAYQDRTSDKTDIISGVDANHDGVRDDIENLIKERYRAPERRRAMIQFSRAEQAYITSSASPGLAIEHFQAVDKSMQCLRQVLGSDYMTDVHEVLAMMLNTQKRFKAYATADKQLAGQVYVAYGGTAPCDQ